MIPKKIKQVTRELWWVVVLGGVISIIFGLMAIFWPGLILATLVTIFSIFVIVMGAMAVIHSIAGIGKDPLWWLSLLFGALSVGLGVFLLGNPNVTIDVFVVLLAIYIFVQALSDLVVASYAKQGDGKWMWVILGLLGIVLGFVIIFFPEVATLTFVWVLGLYAIVHGVTAEVFAFRVRGKINKVAKAIKGSKKSTTAKKKTKK